MLGIGKSSEVGGISELKLGTEGFMKIKPETGITFEQSKNFLESLFKPDSRDRDIKVGNTELTDADRKEIMKKTGWSKEVVDCIQTREQADIYIKADLKEAEINGKKCLIRQDIDMEQKDEFGRTNKERMGEGHPPITNKGEIVELHHIGQKKDSPLAELTTLEHRGKGNDTILHDKQKESEIDRTEFIKVRQDHWKSRIMD